jgi:hypothetical protein
MDIRPMSANRYHASTARGIRVVIARSRRDEGGARRTLCRYSHGWPRAGWLENRLDLE